MTGPLGFLAIVTITVACGGCSSGVVPTAKECQKLLVADTLDRKDMLRFLERAEQELSAAPLDHVDPEIESLGLCVGALKRKAGVIN